MGLHPTFFFLVQTGKKQGAPENRNKGNLSTHSFTISTCHTQTRPFQAICLLPFPLHKSVICCCGRDPLSRGRCRDLGMVASSQTQSKLGQQHPLLLAQGTSCQSFSWGSKSALPRVLSSLPHCPIPDLNTTRHQFLGWKASGCIGGGSWDGQSLHPPLASFLIGVLFRSGFLLCSSSPGWTEPFLRNLFPHLFPCSLHSLFSSS